jgi:hypothetical protein
MKNLTETYLFVFKFVIVFESETNHSGRANDTKPIYIYIIRRVINRGTRNGDAAMQKLGQAIKNELFKKNRFQV